MFIAFSPSIKITLQIWPLFCGPRGGLNRGGPLLSTLIEHILFCRVFAGINPDNAGTKVQKGQRAIAPKVLTLANAVAHFHMLRRN